jgi:hypothetical protein
MWLLYFLKSITPVLLQLSYLAWVGELRLQRFGDQWRAYLRRPYHLLGVLIAWALFEWIIKHFDFTY